MLVGPYHGSVDVVLLPVQRVARVGLALHVGQDARPESAALPAIEAIRDRLPGSVAFGQIAPGRPGLGDPEHAIDDAPVVVKRAATPPRVAGWQERGGKSGVAREVRAAPIARRSVHVVPCPPFYCIWRTRPSSEITPATSASQPWPRRSSPDSGAPLRRNPVARRLTRRHARAVALD